MKEKTNLNGTWSFRMDPCSVGEAECWYQQPGNLQAG